MKYVFYISATFVLMIWGLLLWNFNISWKIHLLPVLAGLIILAGFLIDRELSKKVRNINNNQY